MGQKSHVLLAVGVVSILTIQPAQAESDISRLQDAIHPHKNAALLAQESGVTVIQVTGVQANPTEQGVEIILQTSQGEELQITNRNTENSFIADIPNAQLRLPSGDGFTFRSENPVEGITEITVTNFDANTIRVTVAGEASVPVVALFDSPEEGLIFSIAGAMASTPSPQPELEEPESEIQAEQPLPEDGQPIELIVTGQQDGYRVRDSSTATKTDTPLRDIPASIQVIPRQVLEDQQAGTGLIDTLRNVSGVNVSQSATAAGEFYTIRGFDAAFFQNGVRLPGLRARIESANLERVEVLKGPASVLFGQVEPGGIINLVTKKPLAEPFFSVGLSAGSYDFYRSTIDFSGPLTDDRSLRYRLNAVYENAGSFRDFVESEKFYIAPTLAWDISENTSLILQAEYLNDKRPQDRGLVALSDGIPDIPFSRSFIEPGAEITNEFMSGGYTLEHRFNPEWSIRNVFQVSSNDFRGNDIQLRRLVDEETGTFIRRLSQPRPILDETYFFQTDLTGKFETGSIKHNLLFGFELGRVTNRLVASRTLLDPFNIFDPVFGTVDLSFNRPVDINTLSVINSLGIYLQDQMTLAENLKLLVGGRFDTIDQENKDILAETTTNLSEQAFSPRVGIVYQPIEPISLYASFSQSFVPNSAIRADGSTLEPQRGTQYEAGIKGEFLNGRLSATLAAYEITKSNIPTTDLNDPDFSVPIGEQRNRGIDLDIAGEILPGWNIIASYGYIDAEVTKDNDGRVGDRPLSLPRHNASLWTTYEIQSGDLQGLGVGGGLFLVGERLAEDFNGTTTFNLSSYVRTDAAIYYRRDNFKATLGFKNLFGVKYIETGGFIDPGIPFTVQGSVSWQF